VKIEKSFELARPRQIVWEAFGDVHLVASCLPGASIAEELGVGRYKGKFSIKLGPMAAAFNGEVAIERRPEEWTAVVSGKGADARSSSRANGSMTYRVSAGEGGAPTHVDVVSEINLAGALAQFGKAGVISEIAGRLTDEFVRNFEAKLAPAEAEAAAAPAARIEPSEARSLDAGNLLWTILKAKVLGFIRRLIGRPA